MNTPDFSTTGFAAFIGLDWASQKHDLWLQTPDGAVAEHCIVEHTPAALQSWIAQMRQRFGGRPIAVALELSRGPLIYALMGCEFLVLYPINPKSLARYRQAFRPSGAKDDRSDAHLLCLLLQTHHRDLKPWQPDDVQTRTLASLVEKRRHWVDQSTDLLRRLRTDLNAYYPIMLDLFGDHLGTQLACRFLQRWPDPEALRTARPATLRQFFYGHGSRSETRIVERLQRIQNNLPLTCDAAVIATHRIDALIIVKLLLVLREQIQQLEEEIGQVFKQHPDAFIFQSLPGAGAVLAPRLLVAFGTQREKFGDAKAVQQLSGIAPITLKSGQSQCQYFRLTAPRFLHQTFWEFAKCSLVSCAWARAVVDHLMKDKGHNFNSAVRTLAFKWIRILWRMWQDRVPYNETTYLASLQRKHSRYAPASSAV
jgi:transposase